MDITIIPSEEVIKEKVEYRNPKAKVVEKEYEAPKVELSENIRKFDKKVKVYTENPYSYNYVALKKEKPSLPPSQSASQMITNPTYNLVGKFLGVDTIHDWNKDYDKVYAIVEWAKIKSGSEDNSKLMMWISNQARRVPNMGNRNLDNLYIFARLFLSK